MSKENIIKLMKQQNKFNKMVAMATIVLAFGILYDMMRPYGDIVAISIKMIAFVIVSFLLILCSIHLFKDLI